MPIEVLLLVIVAVTVAVVAVVYAVRAAKRSTPPPPRPAPHDPFANTGDSTAGDPRAIKAGDMIDWGTERTWIRGTLRLSEGGYDWAEHFLEVEGGKRWLSVEEDPDVELALWSGRPDLDLTPHGKKIELEGVVYRLEEKGSGSYRSEGTTGLKPQGGFDYADYESDDGLLLAFERFDHGSWEVSTGTKVAPGTFTIYPGS
ncbi:MULTISPECIES: DUF4178 domain-containing protein [Nocardiopsis]|uniref:DUF4178 domain-containing protein n=1 Tax=Nocardiopsis lambiniae TaxID=3075539 RepID=A0ABU2MDM8_9ACTN|nr:MULTISPECIES: DUF4178 domain-containing protein [unclassified Nocardiopsis]MDE3724359.1 DUF4178 domain-containing protein [Nocardiopsis sp. N85]MDT0330788.1 DUF4178 domain-containing protein [Nocardiopsis sp. DSM 44743]